MTSELPKLSSAEMSELLYLQREYPMEFYTNCTKYFKNKLVEYIKGKRVYRITIMGETRGGKSEIGSTIAFWYQKVFNKLMDEGHFDDIDVFKEDFKKKHVKFNIDYVYSNQSDYMYKLKESHKDKTMVWGQIHQIDENKDAIGGVGSMSELIELTNLNNIIAKFNQCEIWIQPLRLQTKNTPFGLKVVKKDEVNRKNWCLLYKLITEPGGGTMYKFMGWVCVPLHNDEKFREQYNLKKNEWIAQEISGNTDSRAIKRSEAAALMIEKYPDFFKMTDSGKRFVHSKGKMIVMLNRMIQKGMTQNWNELEKDYIVEEAQIIAMEKRMDEMGDG